MLQPSEDPPQLVAGTANSPGQSGYGQTPQTAHQTQQYSQYQQHQQQYQYGGPGASAHVTASQQSYPAGSLPGQSGYGMQGPSEHVPVAKHTGGDAGGLSSGSQRSERPSLWKWVSLKEVVFIFLACSIGAALFRVRDSSMFQLAWEEKLDTLLYRNGKFPLNNEKL